MNTLYLPNLYYIGDRFLYQNEILSEINMFKVLEIGNEFLAHNIGLKSINMQACLCLVAKI